MQLCLGYTCSAYTMKEKKTSHGRHSHCSNGNFVTIMGEKCTWASCYSKLGWDIQAQFSLASQLIMSLYTCLWVLIYAFILTSAYIVMYSVTPFVDLCSECMCVLVFMDLCLHTENYTVSRLYPDRENAEEGSVSQSESRTSESKTSQKR